MKGQNGILVIGESSGGGLSISTLEVLRLGRQIADACQKPLCLIMLGKEATPAAELGFAYGAEQIHMAIHTLLEPYTADAWLQALIPIIQELGPMVALMGHTDKGIDLAPRLAFHLKTGAVLDCVDVIAGEGDRLSYVKPVFGGKAHAVISLNEAIPHVVTIREGAVDPARARSAGAGEVNVFSAGIDANLRVRFVRKEPDENLALANRLTTSNLVVCAGRGVHNQEGVNLVADTAKLLDGAVAGSRPVVDSRWLPYVLQVGLTGKKVHPQVYIAVGISGAIQHMAGCMKSKTIVAINTDEAAPIFKMAHYGLVGDFKAILKGLNAELITMKEGN